jgi:hypothetical protein
MHRYVPPVSSGIYEWLMDRFSPIPYLSRPSTSFQPREAHIAYGSRAAMATVEIILMETQNLSSETSSELENYSLLSTVSSRSSETRYL